MRIPHRFAALLSGITLLINTTAFADTTFPSKPVTFIVPFAPGGISDVMARAIGQSMSTDLKQPVVIVNKPSPGLVLGLTEIARAKPDGYTIGLWFPSAYTFPITMKTQVPYDGIDSFTFIRSYTEPLLGVVVKADAPWKSFQELIDDGKKAPRKLKFGTVGVHSGQHIIMEIVMKKTGAEFIHVPQNGVAAGIANVLGGHLDFLSDASSWAANVRQGQMRVLAYTGDVRSPFFPDTPTFKELGFQVVSSRASIVGPARLPDAVRQRLDEAISKALTDQTVIDAFASVASTVSSVSGEETRHLMIQDRKVWNGILVDN